MILYVQLTVSACILTVNALQLRQMKKVHRAQLTGCYHCTGEIDDNGFCMTCDKEQ